MQQEKAAELLYQAGIRKIIYLPMQIRGSLRKQEMYRRVYQSVQEFHYENIDKVPVYDAGGNPPFVIISQGEHDVSFWCPVEYMRTSDAATVIQNMKGKPDASRKKMLEYADVSIQECEPYTDLFKWIKGERQDAELYLAVMGRISEKEKTGLLADRKCLYEIYEQAFYYNMGFFMDSPARGVWNPKGYFNILDGMHRIQYLYSKGYQHMPVISGTEDFKSLIKTEGS